MSENANNTDNQSHRAAPAESDYTPIAYCQECGRPLTVATLRRVSEGVFCLPCASLQRPMAGWQPVAAGYVPGSGGREGVPGGNPPTAAGANPGWAACLGMIPGVGAMYNGQYVKGAMHLIVFVILVTLADHLNWVFYWLVWGWVFYQAFDAFHTARARRDGLPLPNPFGWNDLGDRLGVSRSSAAPPRPPFVGGQPHGTAPSANSNSGWSASQSATAAVKTREDRARAEADRVFAENPYMAAESIHTAFPEAATPRYGPSTAVNMQIPYSPTYVGVPAAPSAVRSSTDGTRRFPAGAVWLIGLGLIFLLGNVIPDFRLSGRWMMPVLLAALALWSAMRRVHQHRSVEAALGRASSLASAITGPAVLFTVSFLLTLEAADVVSLRRSWPAILIVWGAMLLAQRTAMDPYSVPPQLPNSPSAAVRSTSETGSLGL